MRMGRKKSVEAKDKLITELQERIHYLQRNLRELSEKTTDNWAKEVLVAVLREVESRQGEV